MRFKVGGKSHTESARTLTEARALKADREREIRSGTYMADTKTTLHQYARTWLERDPEILEVIPQTRDENRRLIEKDALRHFGPSVKLTAIKTSDVQGFIDWLKRQKNGGGKPLSGQSVRNAFHPLSGLLGSAAREGLIPSNPCKGCACHASAHATSSGRASSPAPAATSWRSSSA